MPIEKTSKEKKHAEKVDKDFDKIIADLNKDYGQGSVMRLRADKIAEQKAGRIVIPTASLELDRATGVGGLMTGTVVEIYGGESSGKTTTVLQTLANAQRIAKKRELACAFIDAEQSYDFEYADALGVVQEDLFFSQPDNGEQAINIARTMIRSGKFLFIAIDSVAMLVPKAELENPMDKETMGGLARLMGKTVRKLRRMARKYNVCLVFINQTRTKFNVMFGDPEDTPGGKALRFAADMRIQLKMMGAIKKGDDKIANKTQAYLKKNKCAKPHRKALFNIHYGKGVDKVLDLWNCLDSTGMGEWIKKKNKAKKFYVGDYAFNDYDEFKDRMEMDPKVKKIFIKMLRTSWQ